MDRDWANGLVVGGSELAGVRMLKCSLCMFLSYTEWSAKGWGQRDGYCGVRRERSGEWRVVL